MIKHVQASRKVTIPYRASGGRLLSYTFQEATPEVPFNKIEDSLLGELMKVSACQDYFDVGVLRMLPASRAQAYADGDAQVPTQAQPPAQAAADRSFPKPTRGKK